MDSPRNSARRVISSTLTQTNPGAPVQQAPQRVHSNASPSRYQGKSESAELIVRSRGEESRCRLPSVTPPSLAAGPEPGNPYRTQAEEISRVGGWKHGRGTCAGRRGWAGRVVRVGWVSRGCGTPVGLYGRAVSIIYD